jgi:hypothetical protein
MLTKEQILEQATANETDQYKLSVFAQVLESIDFTTKAEEKKK